MAEHIHWKKTTNPNYIGEWDFEDGNDKIVKVKDVKVEVIQNAQGKEEKPVMYFEAVAFVDSMRSFFKRGDN